MQKQHTQEERKNRIVRWVVSHPYVFPASAHTYIYISFLSRSTYHILFTFKKKSIHIHFWHQNGVNKVSCFIDFLYLTWSTNAYMNSKHMHLFFFSYISVLYATCAIFFDKDLLGHWNCQQYVKLWLLAWCYHFLSPVSDFMMTKKLTLLFFKLWRCSKNRTIITPYKSHLVL